MADKELKKNLENMKIHDVIYTENEPTTSVRRVYNGWVYTTEIWEDGRFLGCSSAFVAGKNVH